ncbi:type II toxin-antitoxin system VapC family toxin [Thermococcus barophilus]|uniref:Ribonuclease VapC n=1 Tax=Thermococcus barophilus (strain DSM 11836 / MP) TaxID=391623 RepID=F0LMN7_THEBM|nr:type II toxin-antitoxin system VapC family toxin [Thermococcus barophilus]ADT84016.1 nucleic acid-binding protein [Thermococcus barophilus MP]
MHLVDTDIIIDILRGVKGSKEFLLDLSKEGLFLSVISMAEIFSGKETRDPVKHEKILRFLSHFEVVPLTQEIAILGGAIRRDYQIGLADALIAATAIHNGLTIVTYNTKHFEKVEGLKILKPDYR